MRHILSLFLALCLFFPMKAQSRDIDFGLIGRIENYINNIKTMQGQFTQNGPNNMIAKGRFWLKRPGRMRFNYDPPHQKIVITDGTWLAIQKKEGGRADRYPLISTPAHIILNDNLKIATMARIEKTEQGQNHIHLWLSARDKNLSGRILLRFRKNPLALQGWTIIDPQGQTTKIHFTNIRRGLDIHPKYFFIKEKSIFKRRR